MMNLENLSFLQDETIPLHMKAQTILWWLNIYNGLIDVYTNVQMKRQYYIRELVDIDIFGVGLAQKMLTVIDSTSSRKIRNNYRELIEIL